MPASIELPPDVRQRLLSTGEAGVRWLDALPTVIATLERRWSIAVGRTLAGGTASYVADATGRDGTPLVLKVGAPLDPGDGDEFARSIRALRIANGRGCVRVLAYADDLSAALFERLGRRLADLDFPVRQQLEIIATTVARMWVPVPRDASLPSGADKAAWLADVIETTWQLLARPCAARTIDCAVDYARQRAAAYDETRAVLVHGDAHDNNTLEAGDGTFKLIDAEGLRSEPAHDLAVPMRHYHDELLAGDARALGLDRARMLADLTGADTEAIWQWGFIERVSTGLYVKRLGFDWGDPFLEVADRWAGA